MLTVLVNVSRPRSARAHPDPNNAHNCTAAETAKENVTRHALNRQEVHQSDQAALAPQPHGPPQHCYPSAVSLRCSCPSFSPEAQLSNYTFYSSPQEINARSQSVRYRKKLLVAPMSVSLSVHFFLVPLPLHAMLEVCGGHCRQRGVQK